MAFAHHLVAIPAETSKFAKASVYPFSSSSSSSNESSFPSLSFSSSSFFSKARNLSFFPKIRRIGHKGKFNSYDFRFSEYITA
ncbi:hypothetical protein SLEP1_g52220 [Rubroshorea leprosula]|uniref:Uncharacterized protein n=1 Tax=Rubroshorea leprosula TaxID=152421 RepID=A0AAV5M7W8_9ROSI|nr:hypothetical protein SLEP1_g52220 [Rubroshorea leprosula]